MSFQELVSSDDELTIGNHLEIMIYESELLC